MSTTVLREADGALSIEVPHGIAEHLHLESGTALDVFVEEERMVIQPRKRRYTLDLKEQAEIQDELPVDREWLDSPPAGRELI